LVAGSESGAEKEWRTECDEQRYERAKTLRALLDEESRFRERIR
jgi:hypothetical protein